MPNQTSEPSRQPRDSSVTVELCAGGIDDVQVAVDCDIPRIELNTGMAVGGLTPSPGLVHESRRIYSGTIVAMIRPREGGFCYSDMEFRQMLVDARLLIDAGCDGLAVGFLHADGTLHQDRCAEFRRQFSDAALVFHRAFDVVRDSHEALQQLVEIGFNRILTSGRMPSALDGADEIRRCRERAGSRIEILPGAGIRAENVMRLLGETGCDQIHTSARVRCEDTSTHANPAIHFGSEESSSPGGYNGASREELERLLAEVGRFSVDGRESDQ